MQTTQELIIFNIIFAVMFLQVKVESIPVLDPHPNQITIKLHVSLLLVENLVEFMHFLTYPADFLNDPWSSLSYVSTSVEILDKNNYRVILFAGMELIFYCCFHMGESSTTKGEM